MTAAITIDVDSLRFYRQIHGLPAGRVEDDPIYRVAMPRFFELIESAGIPATLFLIGEDAAAHADVFAPVAELECEIASHSHAHDYRLTQRPRSEIERDLADADAALRPLSPTGRIDGFRAPGYNTSPALLECVVARGYTYDSSLLPAPAYWLARAAAIGRYAVTGRPSRSLVGRARAFAGPTKPYRTSPRRPWRPTRDGPLLEIPMAVDPTSRVPLFGTSWTQLPAVLRGALLTRVLRKLACINFEMHAIDLIDATDPGVPPDLATAQPDLRTPARDKIAAFDALFRRLAGERPMQTLGAIARATSS